MSSQYQAPLVPWSSNGALAGGPYAQSRSPFFSVSNQFLPRNLQDVVRWAKFITAQSPVTTEVLRKLSTYPITSFTYSSDEPAVREKYREIVKSFDLRNTLHNVGFQYFTLGNVFVSIYFPIHRSLECTSCKASFSAGNADFVKFVRYEFEGTCPKCKHQGRFTRTDRKSKNISEMNLILWDPLNIRINHNPITGKSRYYYEIPNEVVRQVEMGNMAYLESTPWEIIEAIKEKKSFEFAPGMVYHLRNIDTGFSANGFAVPPLISHFNLVFYQATLRRANESIAQGFMTPMRVLFPQAQTGNSDPVVALSMRNFTARMEEAMIAQKRDGNHVLIAPVPVGYQTISGEGKTLLVSQELEQAEESLLLSLGVSRELLSGTTNWTSSTVGLRMLRNTLDSYVEQITSLLEWMSAKVSDYMGISECNIGLTPFQLTDDDNVKNMFTGLASSGKVSMTTLFESMGRSYDEELERIMEDAKAEARTQVRTEFEVERAKYMEGTAVAKIFNDKEDYSEILQKAQMAAAELKTMDPTQATALLKDLRLKDYGQYVLISHMLEADQQPQAQDPNAQPGQGGQTETGAPAESSGTMEGQGQASKADIPAEKSSKSPKPQVT